MTQLQLDALCHLTSELSVNVLPATGVGRSVAHLEVTAPNLQADLSARPADHSGGPAIR